MEIARRELQRCEKEIQRLVGQAATEGDYDAVMELTQWALEVRQLGEKGSRPAGFQIQPVVSSGKPESGSSTTPGSAKSRKRKAAPARARKANYPKFRRSGTELVKIGWSKRKKSEYVHRSPGRVISLLAEKLEDCGADGKLFTTENVMPVADPESGGEVPSYQVYLCLAWFRHEGLVEQLGRQGYRLAVEGDLGAAAEARLKELADNTP